MRYTRQDLRNDFPDDNACLEWLVNYLYPEGILCPNDNKLTPHHKLRKRKAYSCELCGHHTYPLANTIFHKSSTPLTVWFDAIFIMSATRSGISAKQLERELGVTYKTAWRMFHQIRSMMNDDDEQLEGEVEIDEAYFHPNPQRRSTAKANNSQVVLGMVERKGRAKVRHIPAATYDELIPRVTKEVKQGTTTYTDGLRPYRYLRPRGLNNHVINHAKGVYVRGDIYTQNVENLWSNMKRGIYGVYRHVDPKYLQAYANEYAFRYSHRNDIQPMFWAIMNRVAKTS